MGFGLGLGLGLGLDVVVALAGAGAHHARLLEQVGAHLARLSAS